LIKPNYNEPHQSKVLVKWLEVVKILEILIAEINICNTALNHKNNQSLLETKVLMSWTLSSHIASYSDRVNIF
jgi:plasmid rolling circle replication initiator protein Rep